MNIDFGQRGVILRLGEVRSFIRKPYKHSHGYEKPYQDHCIYPACCIYHHSISLLQHGTIRHGEIDYSLIGDGKPPLYAKKYAAYSDGGTIWYKGIGYSVYNIHEDDGVQGYLVGPRIRYSLFVFGGKNRESLHFRADTNKNP